MSASEARIRRLFLEQQPTYSIAEAAELFDMSAEDVREWIDSGEIEPFETDAGPALPWAEVVSFGLDFWSQAAIESALANDVVEVIPELLRLTALEVHIPRLEVLALEHLAARDAKTVDTVLARELLDVVSANAECLGMEIAGLEAELLWPEVCSSVSCIVA